MKRKFTFTILAMLFALLSTNLAWGAEITFNPASDQTFPKDGITISVTGGTLTNGTDYRVYKNQTMTISSTVGNITKIEFTYSSTDYDGGGWASTYTPNAASWTSPTANGEQARITQIKVTTAGSTKTLTSLVISGTPTKTTYEAGEEFDPAGLVVTGTYDDESQETITSGITWNVTPNPLTAGTTSVSVTATVSEITSAAYVVNGLTVNQHIVTPGTYHIVLNNVLYGISTGNNQIEQSVTTHDITVISGCTPSASSKTYYDANHIRYYADSYLKLSVPAGYEITSVVFTDDGTWNGSITSTPDTYNAGTKTWSGNSQTVDFAFGAQNRASKITVTFVAKKTLQSIAVKTPPTTTSYKAGDFFAPAGLVITATYDDATTEDIAYAGNEDKFTFEPSTSTVLTTDIEDVTITYGGESTTQAISVRALYTYNITWKANGEAVSLEPPTVIEGNEIGTLPTPDAENIPNGFGFAGWSSSESSTATIGETDIVNADVTLYAVFSRVEGGSGETIATLTNSDITGSSLTQSYGDFSITNTYGTWSGNACKGGNYGGDGMYFFQLRNNATTSYLKLPVFPGNITSVVCEQVCNASKERYTGNIYFRTAADNNADAIVTATSNEALDNVTLNIPSGYTTGYIMVSNPCRIFSFTVTYQSGVTRYYTRVFLNETATANITIGGPSIIPASSTLNMGAYTLANATASNLVIEDGGQLICNNEVAATVKKSISAINDKNGWYTIASPVKGSIDAPTAMTSSNEYDLYYYDEPEYTWRNYEYEHHSSFHFQLANEQGYLYANGTATDIEFAGTLRAGNEANVVVNLSYASTYQKLKGFNLVGNPFAHNIIMGSDVKQSNGYTSYYVVENGSNLVAKTSETPIIKPCQGFMVQATGKDQTITFNPSSKETQTEHEYITIAAGNGDFMDMAYICTNADEKLGKIALDNPTAKVYLRQGANDYAIAPLGEATSMVVCFKAPASGTYTINVSSDHEGVSLKDMKTGYVTAINHSTSYTFEASENDAESRFKIMFGTTVEENEAQMFVFQSGSNLIISGEGTVQIIDMMGRVLRTAEVESNVTVSTEGMTAGTYVVRMLTAGGVQTQKVIVK